jgi:hypothetical protein
MVKAEQAGVKRQPLVWPAWMLRDFGFIARIAEDRVACFGKMDANLIAAARFQPHLHERCAVEMGYDAKMRDGKLSDRFVVGRESRKVLVGGQERLKRSLFLL